ncbi:hypothetical protein DDU33_07785 [Actinobacillus porcitonsillarum]|uniref:Uncharacterized protein n=1 Tax=Actinobacillus porcitonsillarum TaxID=189834 RepID=A0A2U8FK54_9PAST|nr:hypothetical protein [Actinobacillus porcitonsillarum]AWI51391.1 hypothetical protein DDU33_07785 [Actinobacillus porcitonsillarum]
MAEAINSDCVLHPLIQQELKKARKRIKKYIQMGVIVKGDVASLARLGLQQKKDFDEYQKKQKSTQQKAQALQRLEQKAKIAGGLI